MVIHDASDYLSYSLARTQIDAKRVIHDVLNYLYSLGRNIDTNMVVYDTFDNLCSLVRTQIDAVIIIHIALDYLTLRAEHR